ncbi:MAG: hypothetical protein WA133_13225 [Syntrophales bacterium]
MPDNQSPPLDPKVLAARITEYLSLGGLFNPEMANHDAVRDLLIDCRAALSSPEQGTEAVSVPPEAAGENGVCVEHGLFLCEMCQSPAPSEQITNWERGFASFCEGLGVSLSMCGGSANPEAWKELGEFAAKLIRKSAASQGEAERYRSSYEPEKWIADLRQFAEDARARKTLNGDGTHYGIVRMSPDDVLALCALALCGRAVANPSPETK